MKSSSGRYLKFGSGQQAYQAFVPAALPPQYKLTEADYDLMERANRALGRLDGIATLLPDKELFLFLYVRKEAVLSSQIEGTQSSLVELLAYETGNQKRVPDIDDVEEVSRYVAALNHGLKRLRQEDFPLSLRLIREIHEVLMKSGRGSHLTPGEFRRSQNWLGGDTLWTAKFVPPPINELGACLDNLENFLHRPDVPILLKAAIAHVQFETIHPFLDGNGRTGRLLITFLLCAEDVLAEPLLYLSLYFKTHRQLYYKRLNRVRTHGEWREWILFFLEGVRSVSMQAVQTAQSVMQLFMRDRSFIKERGGRRVGSLLQVHESLQRRPIATVSDIARTTSLTNPTARRSLEFLAELKLIEADPLASVETYGYHRYLDILESGIEAGV